MKLPVPFLKSKKAESKYYLALLLGDAKIAAVILEEGEGKVKIVGKHEEHPSTNLESIPQDEFIALIDKVISRAEEALPPDIETHKTVFGVKEDWVDKESKKINKEHLAKLKKVCDSLDLKPIGFMVISEAIANLIQSEEGSPLSAILVELFGDRVSLTLFRGGQVSEKVHGVIEHSVPVTVDTLLKKFTAPVLPTKIILSHTKDSAHLSQQFTNHEWSKSLPFLHVPQITVLPSDFDAKAVVFGAAVQMGFDVLGLETPPLHKHEEDGEHEEEEKNVAEEDLTPAVSGAKVQKDNFGFVTDQDIAKNLPEKHAIEKLPHEHAAHHKHEDEAIKADTSEEAFHVNLKDHAASLPDEENMDLEEPNKGNKKNVFSNLLSVIPVIKFPKIPKLPSFIANNKGLKLPLIILGAGALLVIVLSLLYFYNGKAEVVLSVKPREVTQGEQVTFSTEAGSDFSENIIAAQSVETVLDGDLTIDTTGKKDVGEAAKGTVTIYNSDNARAELKSGTEIKSSNGLSFTLDKDINIASASGDIFSGTKPGTADVNVKAKEIGNEGNLPSGTRFTVGGNSDLAAKNDSAFSGGSKKSVTVVSKKDLDKLRLDLPKNLEAKAREELSKKAKDGQTVLPTILSSSLKDEKFDKKELDEAKTVKLTAAVSFVGLVYNNDQISDYSKSKLKDKYSEDIVFAESSPKIQVKNIKNKDDSEIDATLDISAGLLPEINTSEVADKLQNKSAKSAKETLETLPQVVQSEIKYSPNLFFLSNLFPRLPKNISVTVKAE